MGSLDNLCNFFFSHSPWNCHEVVMQFTQHNVFPLIPCEILSECRHRRAGVLRLDFFLEMKHVLMQSNCTNKTKANVVKVKETKPNGSFISAAHRIITIKKKKFLCSGLRFKFTNAVHISHPSHWTRAPQRNPMRGDFPHTFFSKCIF